MLFKYLLKQNLQSDYVVVDTLESALGSAGAVYIDPNDSPAHFTNMTCISDLPNNFDPRCFFLLYPGVFFEQKNFYSFCFSGLRWHSGTPPIAPPGTSQEILEWAIWVTLISYPPGSILDNHHRILSAAGGSCQLYVTLEMTMPEWVLHHHQNVWLILTHNFLNQISISQSSACQPCFFCIRRRRHHGVIITDDIYYLISSSNCCFCIASIASGDGCLTG